MSHIRIASLILPFVIFLWTGVAQSQTTISASVNITRPSPSCTVSGTQDLEFGSYQMASGTNGTATVNPAVAEASLFTSAGAGTWGGTPDWGTFAVTVNNTSTNSTVAMSYPTNLETGASCAAATCRIPFSSGTVAFGTTATQAIFSTSGTPLTIGSSGVGSSSTRYYRVGGSLSGIALTKDVGVYEGDITITVTCGT